MKSFLAALVLVSGFSQAAEIKVYEAATTPWTKFIKGNFAVNKQMGRAWVEVELSERGRGPRDSRDIPSYARAKVEGLYFDAETSKIMLEHEGQLIECGYRTGRGIFKRIKETGCKFEARRERRLFDDGFRTYTQDYNQLFLVTK